MLIIRTKIPAMTAILLVSAFVFADFGGKVKGHLSHTIILIVRIMGLYYNKYKTDICIPVCLQR